MALRLRIIAKSCLIVRGSGEARCELQLSPLSRRPLTICISFGSGTTDMYTIHQNQRAQNGVLAQDSPTLLIT